MELVTDYLSDGTIICQFVVFFPPSRASEFLYFLITIKL